MGVLWIGQCVCVVLRALKMLSAEESNCTCFPLHTAHAAQHLCLYCVRPYTMIKIRVWFEFEWLRNWILYRLFLIVSIDVIADNGTWAVSVCCMATASCVPHVGVWTIAHRNVVRIKESLYIWPCYRLLIASAQTRCAPNSRQLTPLLELSGEGTWGLRFVFRGYEQLWIPSDTCFEVNSRRVEVLPHWCNYKELLIIRSRRINMWAG